MFVVLECGERDLATRLQDKFEVIDDTFIKYYWQEMLRCVKVIHDRSKSLLIIKTQQYWDLKFNKDRTLNKIVLLIFLINKNRKIFH